jgi:carbohydrate kinase (thermoresistant glucokinase family)
MLPSVILVMGVSGSGKSTVGRALAEALGADFLDADTYHTAGNIARMQAGIPLDDAARLPWLHAVREAVDERVLAGRRVVFACSALKASYRHILLDGLDDAAIVHLDVGHATLEERLEHRRNHFMPAGLLDSQLADLEVPEHAIIVDASRDLPDEIAAILDRLGPPDAGGRPPAG